MRPRPIIKGATYLVTRRTTQGQFLLRPRTEVKHCIRYCLARALNQSSILLHSVCFLSNHYHLVLTDPEGELPAFTEHLNGLIARSLNCLYGRWENLWAASTPTSYVRLESEFDVLAKTVYTLANPTAAWLVPSGRDWPGVRLFRKGIYKCKRPDFYFRSEDEGGELPAALELLLTPPPIGVDEDQCNDVVLKAVSAREAQLRAQAKAEKRSFLGASVVRNQDINATPRTKLPRRKLSPKLACRDKWRRIEALQRLTAFAHEHKECRAKWLDGEFDACFPVGTYQFVKLFGARCAEN